MNLKNSSIFSEKKKWSDFLLFGTSTDFFYDSEFEEALFQIADYLYLEYPEEFESQEGAILTGKLLEHAISFYEAKAKQLLEIYINEILHDSIYQRCEAAWRGLSELLNEMENTQFKKKSMVKIKILSMLKEDLESDLSHPDVQKSKLFQKIYFEEFDTPGGEPAHLILADYDVAHFSSQNTISSEIVLKNIAKLGSLSFAPVILNVSPDLFGCQYFFDLRTTTHFTKLFLEQEYDLWNRLRNIPEMRFLGLVCPKKLMRPVFENEFSKDFFFPFQENITQYSDFLWGGSIYAFGVASIRSFLQTGWFENIPFQDEEFLSVRQNDWSISPVERLILDYQTPEIFVDVLFPEEVEHQLNLAGIITLCANKKIPHGFFLSTPSFFTSITKQNIYLALEEENISYKINYILCASRFAHFIKIIGRNKIGSFQSPEKLQKYIQSWINSFCSGESDFHSPFVKYKPLKDARIRVIESPQKKGHYVINLILEPHFFQGDLGECMHFETILIQN